MENKINYRVRKIVTLDLTETDFINLFSVITYVSADASAFGAHTKELAKDLEDLLTPVYNNVVRGEE